MDSPQSVISKLSPDSEASFSEFSSKETLKDRKSTSYSDDDDFADLSKAIDNELNSGFGGLEVVRSGRVSPVTSRPTADALQSSKDPNRKTPLWR